MTLQEFQQQAVAEGMCSVGTAMCGVFRGYPYSAVYDKGGRGQIKVNLMLQTQAKRPFFMAVKGNLPAGCSCTAITGGIVLLCTAKNGDLWETFHKVLEHTVNTLRDQGLASPEYCGVCKLGGCDSAALVGSAYVPVHKACMERRAGEHIEQAEQNQLNGNYFTGFLGAFLGALVGMVPTLLAAWVTNRIYAILYALIPICAYQGYKLLKGKLNRFALVSSIVCSAFSLLVMELGVYYYQVYRFFGPMTPAELMQTYLESVGAMSLIQDGLFLLLGIWIAWGAISRTAVQSAAGARLSMDTLLPLSGQGEENRH